MTRWWGPGAFGVALYSVLQFASVTAAGLAFFMGRFLAAAWLLALAGGIGLRLWRARRQGARRPVSRR